MDALYHLVINNALPIATLDASIAIQSDLRSCLEKLSKKATDNFMSVA